MFGVVWFYKKCNWTHTFTNKHFQDILEETMFMQHEKLGQAAMSIVSDNYTNCHCQMQKIKEVIFMHYWWSTVGKRTEPYGAECVAGIVAKLQSYSSSAF